MTSDKEQPTDPSSSAPTSKIMDLESFLTEVSTAEQGTKGVVQKAHPINPADHSRRTRTGERVAGASMAFQKDNDSDQGIQNSWSEVDTNKKLPDRVGSKLCALVSGIVICIGILLGILSLVDFMKTNNIDFDAGPAGSASISFVELATHNLPDEDCWIVFHGEVYDMTQYPKRHPSGPQWITPHCGADGTGVYDLFHSRSLLSLVEFEKLGVLEVEETIEDATSSIETEEIIFEDEDLEADAPTANPLSSGLVTLSELSKHDESGVDCWTAYHGRVFDMTDYQHPGSNVFIRCGVEDTADFAKEHPEAYLAIVMDKEVGRLLLDTNGDEEEGVDEEEEEAPTLVVSPTIAPTDAPVPAPTSSPTTLAPTGSPTTNVPTKSPTKAPTSVPTETPTDLPITSNPTESPITPLPTNSELSGETSGPTIALPATFSPTTKSPTPAPTASPTETPTETPTASPTPSPTESPTASPTESPTKRPVASACLVQQYSLADVAQQNDEESCWYALYGRVWDVTPYLDKHKGGKAIMLPSCGTDAQAFYENFKKHDEDLLDKEIPELEIGLLGSETREISVDCETGLPLEDEGEQPPPPTESACSVQQYSLADVSQQNDEESCWYALYGRVWDVTPYLDKHKGGKAIMLPSCGTDAQAFYENFKKHDEDLLDKEIPELEIGLLGSETREIPVDCATGVPL